MAIEFYRYQFNVLDLAGNVVPAASVSVLNESDSSPADLFEDSGGVTPASNPLTADGDGYVFFYVEPGLYEITATDGNSPPGFSHTWEDVHIGGAIELDDLTDVTITSLGDGELLASASGVFINRTLAELDLLTETAADTAYQPIDADLTTLSTAFTSASASGAASLDFHEDTDNGTNRVRLQGAASTADVTVTLPAATDTLVGKATSDVLTNKTFDANGTGNSLSNVEVADLATSAVTTAADTIAGNDSDSQLPTSAAVIDYAQPLDADLTDIAGLSPTNDDVLQRKAGAWANRTIANLRTDLYGSAIALTGGATGATPTPQLTFGSYFDNAGNVSVSHIDLFSGGYGWGISAGSLNHIAGGTHRFFVNNGLATPVLTIKSNGDLETTGAIELGNASDTTIARSAAGTVQIEGVTVSTASNSLNLTNKTLTTPVLSGLMDASAASAGILFASDGLGTSSNENALDAYEEGTWTPTLVASGTQPTGMMYTTQVGHYTKIGDTVICFIRLVTSNKGTGGTVNSRVGGLPFTSNAVAMFAQGLTVGNVPLQTNFTTHVLNVNPSADHAGLVESGNNVVQTATTWANLTNTTTIIGCFIYKV